MNTSHFSTPSALTNDPFLFINQHLTGLLGEQIFIGALWPSQQLHNSSASIGYLGVEIHGQHQGGDWTADEVDQNEDGVLIVFD